MLLRAAVPIAMACLMSIAQAAERPRLTVAVNAQPSSLEAAEPPFAANLRVTYNIYDTLIMRDFRAEMREPGAGVKLVPGLATAWRRIDDRTLELTLRPGVRFHSGKPFGAEDVAFSLSPERLFGEGALVPQARGYVGDIEAVEIVDPTTVRVRAKAADSVLEHRLASYQAGIVPKGAYEAKGPNGFKRAPVGTGPFRVVEWRDNEVLRLAAFDDHWGGQPTVAALDIRIVPEASTRLAGLLSGEFDIITAVTADQAPVVEANAATEIRSIEFQSSQVLVFDIRGPVVADVRIRRALGLAVNRKLIVDTIWHGQTYTPNSWQIAQMGALYNPARDDAGFDPAAARRMLAEAGYKGERITFRYAAQYYPNGDAVAQAVAKMWRDVGVDVRIEVTETIGQALAGRASVALVAFSYDMPIPEKSVCQYYGAGTRYKQWFPPMPRFFDGCATLPTLTTEAERYTVFQGMLDELKDAAPIVLLYQQPQTYGVRKSVQWLPYPVLVMDFRPTNLSPSNPAAR